MTPQELVKIRSELRLSQSEMGNLMGLSLRGYQNLEAGTEPVKLYYQRAVQQIQAECLRKRTSMNENVSASAEAYALAAFQLARATQAALIDKGVLTRRDAANGIRNLLEFGGAMPGPAGAQATALLNGIIDGFRQNDPSV